MCILFLLSGGSNFLNIIYPFSANPISSTFLIMFNIASGYISCHFIIQTVRITKLDSMFEIACLLSEGRASVLWLSSLLFTYYGLGPCIFLARTMFYLQA